MKPTPPEQKLADEIAALEHDLSDIVDEARRDTANKADLRAAGLLLQVRLDEKRRQLRQMRERMNFEPFQQIDHVARVTGNLLLGGVLVLVIVGLGLHSCGALVP